MLLVPPVIFLLEIRCKNRIHVKTTTTLMLERVKIKISQSCYQDNIEMQDRKTNIALHPMRPVSGGMSPNYAWWLQKSVWIWCKQPNSSAERCYCANCFTSGVGVLLQIKRIHDKKMYVTSDPLSCEEGIRCVCRVKTVSKNFPQYLLWALLTEVKIYSQMPLHPSVNSDTLMQTMWSWKHWKKCFQRKKKKKKKKKQDFSLYACYSIIRFWFL